MKSEENKRDERDRGSYCKNKINMMEGKNNSF